MFLTTKGKVPKIAVNEYEYQEILPSIKQAFELASEDNRITDAMRDKFSDAAYLIHWILRHAAWSKIAPQFLESELYYKEEVREELPEDEAD